MAKAAKKVKTPSKKVAAKKTVANKVKVTTPQQLELLEQTAATATPSPFESRTLQPGFLIGLKTSVKGNVSLRKEVIEPEHRLRTGAERTKWQTERTVSNPEEQKKAEQVRMKARMLVVNECAISAFGLLCPESNVDRLKLAYKEAKRIVATFNRTATISRVSINVISGRVATSDVEAARAIKGEVQELLAAMATGVKELNAEAVRKAATQARSIGSMLAPGAAATLKGAIDAARGIARKIVKAGDNAANEIDRESLRVITQARTAFIDLDEEAEQVGSAEQEGRPVDIEAPTRYRPEAAAEA